MSKPVSDFEAEIGRRYTIGKANVVIEDVLAEGKLDEPLINWADGAV